MKGNIQRHAFQITVIAAALLAACLLAGIANAQSSALEGKFTLPYAAHWGQAVLPAGDYLLSITTTGSPALVIIRDARSGQQVAVVAPQTREVSTAGDSALLIATRGTQQVIYSFRVAELGVIFITEPALAHGNRTKEEAQRIQVVPVAVAKK